MSSQIFRTDVPNIVLYNLLEKICLKTDKYYLIDTNAYKKMLFHNYHTQFLSDLRDYYHVGKYFYLNREMTYKSFTNIVRQICKNNTIMFTSKMKYNESKYNIVYFVYF